MKRLLWIGLWILSATVICSAQSTFYFPHIANGVIRNSPFTWKTTILLTNPSSTVAAAGRITFMQDNQFNLAAAGSLFSSIVLQDQAGATVSAGGIVTFSIPPGQTRKYTSTGAGDYSGGFATVTTDTGAVIGTSIFSEFINGRLFAEAGVPSATAAANQAIFVDTQGGFNVGVAYSNVGSTAASLTLSLIGSDAATVATTTQTLGANNHNALFLIPDIFTSLPPTISMAGRMEIRSNGGSISTVALRFDRDSGVFTTLPQVTIASLLSPAVEWLEDRPWLSPLTSLAKLLGSLHIGLG
jgi:hypothetical protein